MVGVEDEGVGELLRLARFARSNQGCVASEPLLRRAVAVDPRNVEARLELADDLRELGQIDEPQSIYRDVLSDLPQSIRAHVGLAYIARKRGDRETSLRMFLAAAQAAPNHEGTKLEVASDLRELGRAEEAEKIYLRLLEENANSFGAHVGLGHVARQRGDRNKSLRMFQVALQASPKHEGTKLEVANDLRELGRVDGAEEIYRSIFEEHPNSFAACVGLALCARKRGDRETSLRIFLAAAQAAPNHEGTKLEVASDLREVGRMEEAEKIYLRLLEENANSFGAHVGLGHVARQRGDRDTSLRMFKVALQASPKHEGTMVEVANDLRELGKLDDAEEVYRSVFEEQPNSFGACVGLAQCARKRGDRETSLRMFLAAAQAAPNHEGTNLEVASDLRELGRLEEAEKIYLRLLEENADSFGAHVGLGHVARQRGDLDKSLRMYQVALQANPKHEGTKLEVANNLRGLGRLDDAEEVYRSIFEEQPNSFGACVGLALCARKRGDRETSLRMFRAASQADPKSEGAHLEVATDLRELGQLEEAEAVYRGMLNTRPNAFGASVGLAHVARRRGDHETSLRMLQAAWQADPTNNAVKLELANDLRALNRLEEAERALRAILDGAPDHVGALTGLAHIERRKSGPVVSLALFKTIAEANPADIEPWLQAAQDMCAIGQYVEADTVYQRILEQDPSNFSARVGLALLARRRFGSNKSLPLFRAIYDFYPEHVGIKLELAADLRELSRPDEAEAIYRGILHETPNHIDAQIGLAQVVRISRGRRVSVEMLGDIAKSWPNHVGALLEFGHDLRELYRLDDAQAVYQDILAKIPRQPLALLGLAQIVRQRGDRAQSVVYCEAAAGADASNLGLKFELSAEFMELGRYGDAERIIDTVLAIDPKNAQGLMQAGQLARRHGDRRAALSAFTRLAAHTMHYIQAHVEAAIEQRTLGRPKESEQLLEHALGIDSNHQGALLALAEHALLASNVEKSMELCRRALDLFPASVPAALLASRAAFELGQRRIAHDLLDRAEERCGLLPELAGRRAELYRQAGDYEAAYTILRDAELACPRNFLVRAHCIHLRLYLHEFDAAAREIEELSAQTVLEHAQIAVFRGLLAEGRWNLDEAIAHHRRSLELNPNSPGAHNAIARLKLLLFELDGAAQHLRASIRLNEGITLLRNQSLNVSQNHLGQVLDDCQLDRAALGELRAMASLPHLERIGLLRDLIRNKSDLTSAAIALIVALRQANILPAEAIASKADNGRSPIPRQMMQYWDDRDCPTDIEPFMASWSERNPSYSYVRFCDETARDFLASNLPADVRKAYDRAKHAAQKADIFRLAYLVIEGGFYADADDQSLIPLDQFVPANAAFVGYQEEFGTIGNNFLGVTPNHQVIAKALENATMAINRGDDDMLWLTTGPGLITRSFALILAQSPLDASTWLEGVAILSCGELRRAVATHSVAAYKRTRNHWLRESFSRTAHHGGVGVDLAPARIRSVSYQRHR
jgi:tetratricopeptide (TPR) repeat protein